jgi:sRNA-binding carbon storage regulator CsrA
MIVPPSTTPQIIDVTVIEVRGEKSRLGIEADKSVQIHRLEISEAREGDRAKSAKPPIRPLLKIGDPPPGEQ